MCVLFGRCSHVLMDVFCFVQEVLQSDYSKSNISYGGSLNSKGTKKQG